jgi:phospholipid/cholesterol/gamma-HCH transport system substrate-binding protein
MSKKANPAVIGGFVVGAVLLFVIGIVIFSKETFWVEKPTRVLYFEGSVSGLDVGSPVNFKGVRIGTVSKVRVRVNFENKIIRTPVYIEIDRDRLSEIHGIPESAKRQEFVQELIQRGLRAQLALQSLITGQIAVELDMHPGTPINLVGADSNYLEIPTIPSSLEELTQRFEKLRLDELVNSLLRAVQSIDQTVRAPELKKTLHDLDETLISIRKLTQNIDEKVGPLSASLQNTSKAARLTLEETQDMVSTVKVEMNQALKDIQKLARNVDSQVGPLAKSIDQTSKTARGAFEEGRKTLSTAGDFVAEDSPERYELNKTLKELSTAARSIRNLARYLERNPNALVYGKHKSGGK